ncbi:Derlin, partial [Gorgonomyces haynaldii]
ELMLLEWYMQVPPVTRIYLTLVGLVTVLVHLNYVTPVTLFFSKALLKQGQYWRLVTSFFYLGELSLDWVLHVYFLARYCEQLETGAFRNRTADFLYMMLLFWIMILLGAWFVKIPFLSQSLVFAVTYLWSRRNPNIPMGFFGVLNFQAAYLCWVLIGFSVILHQVIPTADFLGLLAGHIYYYLEDVYPRLLASRGQRLLKTPLWLEQ